MKEDRLEKTEKILNLARNGKGLRKFVSETLPEIRKAMRDRSDRRDKHEDGFKAGTNYVYDLPLSGRLTADEKERVRKEYADTCPNDIDCGIENMLIQDVLKRIFGADFFKEEE